MNAKMSRKILCCIVAVVLFILGISVEISAADSSFLDATNVTSTANQTLRSTEDIVEETPVCTPNMLQNSMNAIRGNMTSATRWQDRTMVLFLIVVSVLQFLFYQSTEAKEDGQLFLCRSVIVDYIHLKDSGN